MKYWNADEEGNLIGVECEIEEANELVSLGGEIYGKDMRYPKLALVFIEKESFQKYLKKHKKEGNFS